jgi:hypothetical protein
MRIAAAILSAHLAASPGLFLAPVPPPTSVAPPPPPSSGLSPILTRPAPILGTPTLPSPTPPAALPPSPIDSHKLDAYRFDLLDRRRALERKGVSPATPIAREIQEELLRLKAEGGSP